MKKLEIRFGIYMLAGFVAYFFLMKALGLYTNVNLRVFNLLIHGSIVYLAMRAFRKSEGGEFRYLDTFLVGLRTSILPVITFSTFQFIYLQFLNPSFMIYVQKTAIMGGFLSPFSASVFLVFEGLGVSIFASYIGMRYLTWKENTPSISGLSD